MKRLIMAGAVACASASVGAQDAPVMEHVLVSVPVHKSAAETAMPVTVLTGEELRRQASASIGDTLSNTPGLANASFGPGVGQPVIRGQSGPRVTVLQNGTTSADASNVSADHAVSVEPVLANSIEVLRGPATLLYGGGAIGGVINVIDNRVPTNALDGVDAAAELRYDSASSGKTAVGRIDAGNGKFVWHADVLLRDWDDVDIPGASMLAGHDEHEDDHDHGHEDEHEGEHDEHDEHHDDDHHEEEGSYGVLDNTDGETRSLTLGGAWHFEGGFVGLAVNRLENEYGIPPGGHAHHHDEDEDHDHEDEEHEGEDHDEDHEEEHGHGDVPIRIDLEQTRYDLVSHLHNPLPGLDVVRTFITYTDYEHAEHEGNEVGTLYTNESWELRAEAVQTSRGNVHGSFGLQAGTSEFSAIGEEAFIPVTDNETLGVFVLQDYHGAKFSVEGGLRFDRVTRDPKDSALSEETFNNFSASLSGLYDVSSELQLGVALMRSARAPATEELYSNALVTDPEEYVVHASTGAIEIGSRNLDSEVSMNFDVSIDWVQDRFSSHLSVYYNDFSDYIYLSNTGTEVDEVPVLHYRQDDAEFVGVEWIGRGNLATWDGMSLDLELTADVIRGELDDGGDVPLLPPRRLGAKLTWSNQYSRAYVRVLDAAEQDKPGLNEEETPGYTRWDLGVEFNTGFGHSGDVVLFANLKNVTNEEIRLSTSFLREFSPEAGRSVEAGIRLAL